MKHCFEELEEGEIVSIVDGIFANVASLFSPDLRDGENWGFKEEEDFKWVRTDPPSEYPNLICDARFTEVNVEQRILHIKKGISAGRLPGIFAIGPLSTPLSIATHLIAAGFEKILSFPGMVFDLQNIDANSINNFPLRLTGNTSSLEIRRIKKKADFSDWVDINIQGFSEQFQGSGCEESVYVNLLERKSSQSEVRFYGAYLDGAMVGAAQSVLYSNHPLCKYTELHQCSVISECRQMGIARRLVSMPMLEAKEAGCIMASIFAAPKAADPFWTSMGFKAYCNLDWYMLT